MNYNQAFEILNDKSESCSKIEQWNDFIQLRNQVKFEEPSWVYLIKFSREIFAWGTASKKGDRLRKMSLFHPSSSGKYDRIVDYHMLKQVNDDFEFHVFLFLSREESIKAEGLLREVNGQNACFGGIFGSRQEITRQIFNRLRKTQFWTQNLDDKTKELFSEFIKERLYQTRNQNGRTWNNGDILEPGALERFSLDKYINPIEKVLGLEIGTRSDRKHHQNREDRPPRLRKIVRNNSPTGETIKPINSVKKVKVQKYQIEEAIRVLKTHHGNKLGITKAFYFQTSDNSLVLEVEKPTQNQQLSFIFDLFGENQSIEISVEKKTNRADGKQYYTGWNNGTYIVKKSNGYKNRGSNYFDQVLSKVSA